MQVWNQLFEQHSAHGDRIIIQMEGYLFIFNARLKSFTINMNVCPIDAW